MDDEKMNHVGRMVQKHLNRNYTVLDIGCGVMQATMPTWYGYGGGRIKCRSILGLDAYPAYLNRIKDYPGVSVIKGDVTDLSMFPDNSFDVCLLLDIVEHLPEELAKTLISEAERIARHKVMIYTPSEFYDNHEHGANHPLYEEYGDNQLQQHQCLLTAEYFRSQGYQVDDCENHHSTFSVKTMQYTAPKVHVPAYHRIMNAWPMNTVGPILLKAPVFQRIGEAMRRRFA